MATLTTLRADLRNDLQDTASATFTDPLLERAITRAVGEFERALPIRASATTNGVNEQRRYDLSATAGLLYLEAVEYKIDQDPKAYLPFLEETRGVAYILGTDLPVTGTNNLKLWYAKAHTVDGAGSTIPADLEELLLDGAYAHAILMRAAATIATINPSSWAPRQARELATLRLHDYRKRLADLAAQRASPLWTPHWGDIPSSWSEL